MKRGALTKFLALLVIFALLLPACGKKAEEKPDKTKPEAPEIKTDVEPEAEDTAPEEEEISPEQMDLIK